MSADDIDFDMVEKLMEDTATEDMPNGAKMYLNNSTSPPTTPSPREGSPGGGNLNGGRNEQRVKEKNIEKEKKVYEKEQQERQRGRERDEHSRSRKYEDLRRKSDARVVADDDEIKESSERTEGRKRERDEEEQRGRIDTRSIDKKDRERERERDRRRRSESRVREHRSRSKRIEKEEDRERDRDKGRRHHRDYYGRSRSRSHSPHHSHGRSRSGYHGKSSLSRRKRSISRSASGERDRERRRYGSSSSYSRGRVYEREERERLSKEEERKRIEEEEKKKKEAEEATRDDLTVLVVNLNLKTSEREVYEFFSEHAGKVRDVQCIRDQRSGKLKGVGYVEFYTQEAVVKALALSGQCLCGQPIKVQSSQAEKNRAAKAAKYYHLAASSGDPAEGPMRVYVGGLVEALSNISELELKSLFSPFGEILDVDLHRDPYTGRSKGYAFIQFRKAQDAREAMAAMNGFEIGGREIKVGVAVENKSMAFPPGTSPPSATTKTDGVVGTGATANTSGSVLNANAATGEGGKPEAPASTSSVEMERAAAEQLLQQIKQEELQKTLAKEEMHDAEDNERLDDDDGGGLLKGAGSKLALMQKLQRDGAFSILGSLGGIGNVINANVAAVNTNGIPAAAVAGGGGGGVSPMANLPGVPTSTVAALNTAGNIMAPPSVYPLQAASPTAVLQAAPPPPKKVPANNITSNIVLANMFDESEVNLEEETDFFTEVCEDVKEECKKYGAVVTVWVNKTKIDGRVWVKFASIDQALRAFSALNGRFFGGKPVAVEFVSEAMFYSTCK